MIIKRCVHDFNDFYPLPHLQRLMIALIPSSPPHSLIPLLGPSFDSPVPSVYWDRTMLLAGPAGVQTARTGIRRSRKYVGPSRPQAGKLLELFGLAQTFSPISKKTGNRLYPGEPGAHVIYKPHANQRLEGAPLSMLIISPRSL